jgi:phospholipase/carboxylesterase
MRPWHIIVIIVAVLIWGFTRPSQLASNVPYKLQYKAEVLGKADGPMPMVILLHGHGGNEKNLIEVAKDAKMSGVQLISFRGPKGSSSGYTWADGHGQSQSEAQANYQHMLDDVAKSIALASKELTDKYKTKPKPYVVGFSFGGTLAYELAVKYPQYFSGIFVAGAELPSAIDGPDARIPIYVFHGKADRVVPFNTGNSAAETLKAKGYEVEFIPFEGDHWVPAELWRALRQRIIEN